MPHWDQSKQHIIHSLSFRLQFITVFLSLIGVLFGIRAYYHLYEQYGAEKSLNAFHDLLFQIVIAIILNIFSAVVIFLIATKPIRALGEVMRDLTEGRLDVEVPYVEQTTEIGSIARKVAIFKQNSIDKQGKIRNY
jgi:methyl-accepting chemotaxis protein